LPIDGCESDDKYVPNGKLPNFFVIGAGKAGTTSLYHYLQQHPQIYMSPLKEPGYFASELRAANLSPDFARHIRRQTRELPRILGDSKPVKPLGWLVSDWHDYLRLFQKVQCEKAVGEATPAYLWSETAAANIQARIPDAKIVMILRDPAERAYSQYLHQLAQGLTRYAFRRQIELSARRKGPQMSILHPFLQVGLYHEQVKRYLDRFPRENIRIYWYEEDWQQPARMLADLFAFLGVDAAFAPDTSRKTLERRAPRMVAVNYLLKKSSIWPSVKGFLPPAIRARLGSMAFRTDPPVAMDPNDRKYLIDYYRDDILKLASLLGHDLSRWLR
jgi:Sulfotransferase family